MYATTELYLKTEVWSLPTRLPLSHQLSMAAWAWARSPGSKWPLSQPDCEATGRSRRRSLALGGAVKVVGNSKAALCVIVCAVGVGADDVVPVGRVGG